MEDTVPEDTSHLLEEEEEQLPQEFSWQKPGVHALVKYKVASRIACEADKVVWLYKDWWMTIQEAPKSRLNKEGKVVWYCKCKARGLWGEYLGPVANEVWDTSCAALEQTSWINAVRTYCFVQYSYCSIPITVAIFLVGYYSDMVMNFYTAYQFYQSPVTKQFTFALLTIMFFTPTTCWLLLYSNNLLTVTDIIRFLTQSIPITEGKSLMERWQLWNKATQEILWTGLECPVQAVPKGPVLSWLPVCKDVFGSSLTLLFKIYGVFLQNCGFLASEQDAPRGLPGVFVAILIGLGGMTNSIVSLSHYGRRIGLVERLPFLAQRFFEIFSRVGTVGLFGIVFAEKRSIVSILMLDFVLQFGLLLVHPSSRRLMRNEMSPAMMFFWAALMTLAAPPMFVPQLRDMHAAYFLVRVVELAAIFACIRRRCGWPLGLHPEALHPELAPEPAAACQLAVPLHAEVPFWCSLLVLAIYISTAFVPVMLLVKGLSQRQRRLRARRLQQHRQQRLREQNVHEGPLRYDECLYLKVSSVPNSFLVSAEKGRDGGFAHRFQELQCLSSTEGADRLDLEDPEVKLRAGWRFARTLAHWQEETIRYGDVVQLRSEGHEDRFLSGGRRGNNQFVGTHMFTEDQRSFPLDYNVSEHYKWCVVAINPELGPDLAYRLGDVVDLHDGFALQATPEINLRDMPIFLTGARGTTASKCQSVWTVDFLANAAFEDAPLDGQFPSFVFHACRTFAAEPPAAARLIEEELAENRDRGVALAVAARAEDVLMQSFMMLSGMPMSVTDEQNYSPLHHFVFSYARESDQENFRVVHEGADERTLVVPHKVPEKVFDKMLRSGLPHLQLRDSMLYTPFHYAALLGERRLCDLLLEAGADVNVGDADGWTPLHDACTYEHRDMALYLLTRPGIQPKSASKAGVRPADCTDDAELQDWIERASKGESLPEPPPAGKFRTMFIDPREHPNVRQEKCRLDNQTLAGKSLAVKLPGNGPWVCFFCARFPFTGSNQLNCPMFHCPDCGNNTRIPYFAKMFQVCWCCQPCSRKAGEAKFPNQERIEAGKLDTTGLKAKAIFKKLDKDSNMSLDKAEFKIWFDELHGIFDPQGNPETKTDMTEMPQLSGYAAQLFDKIDADNSGSISIDEFLDYFGVNEKRCLPGRIPPMTLKELTEALSDRMPPEAIAELWERMEPVTSGAPQEPSLRASQVGVEPSLGKDLFRAPTMRPRRTTFSQCMPCLETVLLLQ